MKSDDKSGAAAKANEAFVAEDGVCDCRAVVLEDVFFFVLPFALSSDVLDDFGLTLSSSSSSVTKLGSALKVAHTILSVIEARTLLTTGPPEPNIKPPKPD